MPILPFEKLVFQSPLSTAEVRDLLIEGINDPRTTLEGVVDESTFNIGAMVRGSRSERGALVRALGSLVPDANGCTIHVTIRFNHFFTFFTGLGMFSILWAIALTLYGTSSGETTIVNAIPPFVGFVLAYAIVMFIYVSGKNTICNYLKSVAGATIVKGLVKAASH